MAWEQEIKYLAEADATLVGSSDPALVGDREIKRKWAIVRDDLRSTALTFLNTYTSAANTAAITAGTAQYYVDTPWIDGKPVPGRWRIVNNEELANTTDPQQQGIIQTLRLGYLTTISTTAADWTEAREVTGRALNQTGNTYGDTEKYLRVQFRNLDPTVLGTLVVSLGAAGSFTDPVVKGETRTGTWYNLITISKVEDDGSGTIELVLGDPEYQLQAFQDLGTPVAKDRYYLWNVPKSTAQGIVTAWRTLGVEGSEVTAGYSSEQGLVDLVYSSKVAGSSISKTGITAEWSCRYITTESIYLGLTWAEVTALVLTSPTSGTVKNFSPVYVQETGLWNLTVTSRTSQKVSIDEYTSVRRKAGTVATEAEIGAKVGASLDYATVDLILPLSGSITAGQVEERRLTKNDDCSWDATKQTTTDTYQHEAEYTRQMSEARKVEEEQHLQYVSGDGVVLPDLSSHTDGEVVEVAKKLNPSGSEDAIVTTTTDQYQHIEEFTRRKGKATTVKEEQHLQYVAADGVALPDLTNATTGQVTEIAKKLNPSGSQDAVVTKTVKSAIATAVQYESSDDALQTTTVQEDLGTVNPAAGLAVDLAVAAGQQLTAQVQYDPETNTLDVKKGTSVAKAVTASTTAGSSLVTETVEVQRAATAVLTTPSATAGTIIDQRSTPSEFYSRYDNQRTTRVAVEGTASGASGGSPAYSETTDLTRNASTLNVSAGAAGTLVNVSASLNEFKRLDIVKQTRTANPQNRAGYQGDKFKDVTITVVEEAENPDATVAVTDGQTINVVNRPTQFGRSNYQKEVANAKPVSVSAVDRVQRADLSASIGEEYNAESLPTLAAEVGKTFEVRGRMNEFGKYDYNQTTNTGKKQYQSQSYTDRYGTTYWYWGRNHTAAEYAAVLAGAALTNSTNNSIRKTENEYGLIDFEISKQANGSGLVTTCVGTFSPPRETTVYKKETTEVAGVLYYRMVAYIITDGYSGSELAAISAARGSTAGKTTLADSKYEFAGYLLGTPWWRYTKVQVSETPVAWIADAVPGA